MLCIPNMPPNSLFRNLSGYFGIYFDFLDLGLIILWSLVQVQPGPPFFAL
jgi:hypothetical protein